MNIFNFKYKNDKLYNIISFILFVVLVISIIIILNNVESTLYKILYLLLSFIIAELLLIIINKIICITNGTFSLDKHSFIYESLNNEYTINYQEIESISKTTYLDNDFLIKRENYVYKIKIKNAGYFLFKYYDRSLDDAIEELSLRANKEIDG